MGPLVVMLAGVLVGLSTPAALRALPEPSDSEDKVPYRTLATPQVAVAVGACSVAALAVVAARLPSHLWPLWFPLATAGVLLVGIDALTTWLPLRLTHVLWATTALGASASLVLVDFDQRPYFALRLMLGAALVGALFWTFWRLVGGLGFGDVRLAPVLGAVGAGVSWQVLVMGLLIGTSLGALHGVVRRVRARPGPFPYGPALVIGMFAGLVIFG